MFTFFFFFCRRNVFYLVQAPFVAPSVTFGCTIKVVRFTCLCVSLGSGLLAVAWKHVLQASMRFHSNRFDDFHSRLYQDLSRSMPALLLLHGSSCIPPHRRSPRAPKEGHVAVQKLCERAHQKLARLLQPTQSGRRAIVAVFYFNPRTEVMCFDLVGYYL